MSDAAIGGLETTIGLMPRYLRNRDPDASAARTVEKPPVAADADAHTAAAHLPGMRGASLTDELRRRVTEAATPQKRGPSRLWFGLAAVALIALVCLLFPSVIGALLPNVDTSF